MNIRS